MRKFLGTILLGLLITNSARSESPAGYERIEDVIYGRKFGTALTLDVFQPAKPNGIGILWMVSGGFISAHEGINPKSYEPLLERGYTVFAVVHGSQPKFIIPEIERDIHRAVRFVRHNAGKYGVDPNRLGITGGSAGGFLSLTMGTQGGPGNPKAVDPVDRESSVVQCVACFYPQTDFLNWSRPGEDAVGIGGRITTQASFGTQSYAAEDRQILGKQVSPIYFVTAKMAPTLVMHGDADKNVPLYQAKIFEKRCQEVGAPYKLIIKPGKGHGWEGISADFEVFADWFDEHLRSHLINTRSGAKKNN